MATQILTLSLVLLSASFPLSFCQFSSQQNIQTFYPFPLPPLGLTPPSPRTSSSTPSSPPPPPPPPPPPKSSSKGAVAKAIGVTAASTLVLSALFFVLVIAMSSRQKKEKPPNPYSYSRNKLGASKEFTRFSSKLKGVIVDEDGLDVLYWRNLQGETVKDSFSREVFDKKEEKGVPTSPKEMRQKLLLGMQPLPREKSSSSHQFWSQGETRNHLSTSRSSPPPAPPPPPPPPQPVLALAVPKKESGASPPPPPPIPSKQSSASSQVPGKNKTAESSNSGGGENPMNPSLSTHAISRSPPPPPPPPVAPNPPPLPLLPVPRKKSGALPPPPPPPIPSEKSPVSPPPQPKGIPSKNKAGESSNTGGGDGNGQVKLKPLHWDKVNRKNVNHSMVWDKIEGGSFRFDGDLMEALFGNVATSRKSPRSHSNALNPNKERPNPTSPVFILDARKSQNTAIVIRSLAVSRQEIIDALTEGHGLDNDTLEKLTKIAPTEEEKSQIVAFDGDPTKLADAESFLFHLLRIVPSAFTRFKALLFRSNYDSEILHLKEILQTLETGCNELRTRGLLLKLLEAILKAGNRMNAGTARGNAQGFSLSSLRKLSDVKSTDGKTTLLHFVVEGVVRAEGKRCVVNTNPSLSRGSSNGSKKVSDEATTEEDLEREYKSLGLPIVGGLSAEFANVKKAATIDSDSFAKSISVIEAQIGELVQALTPFGYNTDGGSFLREMKSFLGEAALQVKEVKEEQTRVMALVKKTTEYYQPGASKEKEKHPLQLFAIVKDFLDAVDQACIDISRDLKKKKTATTKSSSSSSSPPNPPAGRNSVRFPMLPDHFLSDKSKSSSSDSDDD